MKLRRILYATALFGYSALIISSTAPLWMRTAGRVLHWLLGNAVCVCDGIADNVEFEAALDALGYLPGGGPGGNVYITDGNYYFAAPVNVRSGGVWGIPATLILSEGATIFPTADVNIFNMGPGSKVTGGYIWTHDLAIWNSIVFYFNGGVPAFHPNVITAVEKVHLTGQRGLNHGKAFLLECANPTDHIYGVRLTDISIVGFTYGIHLYTHAGGGNAEINDNWFTNIWFQWQVYCYYEEKNDAGRDMARNNIANMDIQCGTEMLRGVRIESAHSRIQANVVDVGIPVGAFYSYELTSRSSYNRLLGEFVKSYGVDAGVLNNIDEFSKPPLSPTMFDNLLILPTNAGWTASHVGGGGAQEPSRLYVNTSVAINSRGMLYCSVVGLRPSDNDALYIDWDKKLYFSFSVVRSASDAEVIARIQLKQVNTEGALVAKGVGIRLDNLTLMGESYGASLDAVNLATAFTSAYPYRILIVHYPATKIEWYVNGVLKGTQSTVAKIPSGDAGAASTCVASIINGGTGGVDAYLHLLRPIIWQEE